MSPDGHGGSLRALHRSGALDLMKSEGVDTVSYFQVDNPLVRCVDPEFIGWHLLQGAEMSAKMMPKAYPEEKLGHFCLQHGRLVVIEYSDLPLAVQREIDPQTGRLRYGPAASPSTSSTGSSSGGWRRNGTARRAGAAVPSRGQEDRDHRRRGQPGEARPAERGEVRDVRLRCAAVRAQRARHRNAAGGRFLAGQECRGRGFAAHRAGGPAAAVCPLAGRRARRGRRSRPGCIWNRRNYYRGVPEV
jgi:hypothetical protein